MAANISNVSTNKWLQTFQISPPTNGCKHFIYLILSDLFFSLQCHPIHSLAPPPHTSEFGFSKRPTWKVEFEMCASHSTHPTHLFAKNVKPSSESSLTSWSFGFCSLLYKVLETWIIWHLHKSFGQTWERPCLRRDCQVGLFRPVSPSSRASSPLLGSAGPW